MRAWAMAAAFITVMGAPAMAQTVPPFKGNDTGGIISYHSYPPEVIRDMAAQHCASWGKVAKLTGVQARYGGYVSFACLWRPAVAAGHVVTALY